MAGRRWRESSNGVASRRYAASSPPHTADAASIVICRIGIMDRVLALTPLSSLTARKSTSKGRSSRMSTRAVICHGGTDIRTSLRPMTSTIPLEMSMRSR